MNKNLFHNHLIQITSTGISPKTAPPNTDSIIKKLDTVFALAPAPMTIDRNENNTQRPQSPLRCDVGALRACACYILCAPGLFRILKNHSTATLSSSTKPSTWTAKTRAIPSFSGFKGLISKIRDIAFQPECVG